MDQPALVPLERPRPTAPAERALLDVLAGDALAAQVASAVVVSECNCGCPSVELSTSSPPLPGEQGHRELSRSALAHDGRTIVVTLHVFDGVVHELEVWAGQDGGDPRVSLPPVEALRE
jgi:hypothetical protein